VRKRYNTLTDLWHKSANAQLFMKADELDFIASIDTMVYDNVLSCKSMAYEFDAGRDLWLTKSRFTVLQRDYLDLYDLETFLDRCESIGLGEAKRGVVTGMPCKPHKMSDKKYRWGNCMMNFTYRGGGKHEQPTLVLHSRVSYIAYIGGLDLALAHVLAREIARRVGCEVEDIAFRWHVDSLQFHGFKSIPYLFRLGLDPVLETDEARYPSEEYPTIKLVRRWWVDMVRKRGEGIPWEDEKYGPLKRIRHRYEQYLDGPQLASVPIEQLTFQPLRDRG
jgi:hypothetical protein